MPRLKTFRKVSAMPKVKGFIPFGGSDKSADQIVFLQLEEYEAFRLCDYEGHTHHEASNLMGVSRPTFTRIYATARSKIAIAFAEGRSIEIEGGKVYFDSQWFHCAVCGCYFNQVHHHEPKSQCPLCNSQQVSAFQDGSAEDHSQDQACYCMECGLEVNLHDESSCSDQYCPACHVPLKKQQRHIEPEKEILP